MMRMPHDESGHAWKGKLMVNLQYALLLV